MKFLEASFQRGERRAAPSRPAVPSRDGAPYSVPEGLQ